MMKIGIFGGTFDPPHYGHLMVAQEVLESCQLDKIWFLPSHRPPHKTERSISTDEQRKDMVNLAIERNQDFEMSLVEFGRKGLSYTYDTVRYLTEMHPEHRFSFIIGADMINDLPNWHKIDELIKLISFVGVARPGFEFDISNPYHTEIRIVEAPQFEISSSFLRKRFREKGNTRYFIPDDVRNYIEEKGLYE
ncbi:nicotinate-nucleotide adenylyltransferase [Pseudalkalibacillus caeni]|uniref:Probable nicotinate-nucleotide adenylyltransferase n=1 Tax=Exobacillus caeni TaxID=2574798 RepID=A0A5R9FEM9_9BACL|nr:nicotinate-nucleotide adenylyltransferase [Pseudalkalibacillus caeni]TLS39333.1 nicotinate-nucleotide adenylyltransferase [Pseudalkalibacillus caeni]